MLKNDQIYQFPTRTRIHPLIRTDKWFISNENALLVMGRINRFCPMKMKGDDMNDL